jgi:vesicle transport through interaction with t-SNAREs protein 1
MEDEMKALKKKNEERLAKTSSMLAQTKLELQESEDIAVAVIDDMEQQREQLLNTKRMVWETQDYSNHAKNILRNMQNVAYRKRMALWLTIFALFGAIGYVVWYGYLVQPEYRRHNGN